MPSDQDEKYALFVKRVEESNAKFEKANQFERIVMVSRDVLMMTSLGKLYPEHDVYTSGSIPYDMLDPILREAREKHEYSFELSRLLKMPKLPACSVCAIGGAMIAATLRCNHVMVSTDMRQIYESYENFPRDNSMSARAQDIFPSDLLRTMERAFEGGCYGYSRQGRGTRRFRAIYGNLVQNHGKKFTAYGDGHDQWNVPVRKGECIFNVKTGRRIDEDNRANQVSV